MLYTIAVSSLFSLATITSAFVTLLPAVSWHERERPLLHTQNSANGPLSNNNIFMNGEKSNGVANGQSDPLVFPSQHPVGALYTARHQLWLDLRKTAFLPHEAVQILRERLLETGAEEDAPDASLLDGVLVTQAMMEKTKTHSKSGKTEEEEDVQQQTPQQYNNDDNYFVLYSPDDGNDELVLDASQYSHAASSDQSSPASSSYVVGKTVFCSPSHTVDPLMALDTVVHDQNWLLLDVPPPKDDNDNDNAQQPASWVNEQITTLLQLLAAPNVMGTTEEGVLVLPHKTGTHAPLRGGVAVVCNDFRSFLFVDSKVTEMANALSMHTTESGLMVPNNNNDEEEDTTQDSSSLPLSTALVLPFDLTLWKDVLEIRGMK